LKGIGRFHDTLLYVNRGIGTIFLPLRFLSPPEITDIQLKGTLTNR
jgi:predicted MPP superfamily phosphohydrolase